MNIKLSETIKNLRRERNLTQDDVASALGITYQSVSRWENGLSYPDVELLPAIASFFNVSLDKLFGIDSSVEEKVMNEYWAETDETSGIDENIDVVKKYISILPNNVCLKYDLLKLYLNKGFAFSQEKLDEMRKLCQFIIDHTSEDDWQRVESIKHMILVDDEDNLDLWFTLLDRQSYLTSAQTLIKRYDYRNEVEKYNESIQNEIVNSLKQIFNNNFCKRDKQTYKNAESRVTGQKAILGIIDTLRDPSVEVDAWITDRAFYYLRLSAGSFGAGLIEEGYASLEKAVDLCREIMSIADGTKLTYNSPVLDLISRTMTGEMRSMVVTIYCCMTQSYGWEWFNGVRNTERYQAQVKRISECLKKE